MRVSISLIGDFQKSPQQFKPNNFIGFWLMGIPGYKWKTSSTTKKKKQNWQTKPTWVTKFFCLLLAENVTEYWFCHVRKWRKQRNEIKLTNNFIHVRNQHIDCPASTQDEETHKDFNLKDSGKKIGLSKSECINALQV